MTDSDPTLPNAPAGGTPPPPPPPPPPVGDPNLPTEAVASQPVDPVPPIEPATEGIDPILPPAAAAAGVEATTVMPATEPGMDDGIPPTDPPVDDVPIDEVPEEPVPWYKKPAAIAALVIAVLLIGGLIAWLVLGGDDDSDDDVSPTASRLVLITKDESGASINREISLSVTGPAGAEESFEWLRPPTANPGEAAVVSSGDNGRAAFDWQPDDTVTDPASWAATLIFSESVPPGWTPPWPDPGLCARAPRCRRGVGLAERGRRRERSRRRPGGDVHLPQPDLPAGRLRDLRTGQHESGSRHDGRRVDGRGDHGGRDDRGNHHHDGRTDDGCPADGPADDDPAVDHHHLDRHPAARPG